MNYSLTIYYIITYTNAYTMQQNFALRHDNVQPTIKMKKT